MALIRWDSAAHSHSHGEECGDGSLVAHYEGGALLAVVDGLGHGAEAALATQRAISVLNSGTALGLEELVRECHRALRKTRGAVMSLVQIHFATARLIWVGVGNVEAIVCRPGGTPSRILARPGVVGYNLPPSHPEEVAFEPGDFLIMASDGLRSELATRLTWSELPGASAVSLLDRFSKGNDDALLLLVERLSA